MTPLQERLDLLANQADQLWADIIHEGNKLKKECPEDPPGWYEDCIYDLNHANEIAAKLYEMLNAAWLSAGRGSV
jgi:hypothetical protein